MLAGSLARLSSGTVLAGCTARYQRPPTEEQQTLDLASATQVSCHRSRFLRIGHRYSAIPTGDASGDRATSVTTLIVGHTAPDLNDSVHFRRIGDAIAAARAGRLARGELRRRPAGSPSTSQRDHFVAAGIPVPTSLEHWPLTVRRSGSHVARRLRDAGRILMDGPQAPASGLSRRRSHRSIR